MSLLYPILSQITNISSVQNTKQEEGREGEREVGRERRRAKGKGKGKKRKRKTEVS